MKPVALRHILPILASIPSILLAVPGDADNDGLRDEVETGTGIYVSPSNTGTNPNVADTDGDGVPDGMEVNLGTNPCDASSTVKRPNIIYILVDDLGYGDVGCFWQNQKTGTQKFATPNLDAMAAGGAKMTHCYAGAPICASSRASFLQGRHQGHSNVRDSQFDKKLEDNHTVARVLQSAGYHTVHIGKAGLIGYTGINYTIANAYPLVRGFDRFFGYLSHANAHEHYPRNGTTDRNSFIYDDRTPITDAYQDLYSTDAWTAFAKKTIIEETQNHPKRPFFIYLAYDTPHFFPEFPPTATYPAGRGVNGGVQWTGSPSYVNTATNDPSGIDNAAHQDPSVDPTWPLAYRQYASMVHRLDDAVSDLLQTLRDLNIDKNTLVVFTSDNGPEALYGVDPQFFQSYGGFEGMKEDLYEGGIRMPTIVSWPGTIPATNQLSSIREISRPCASYDWMATFAELAKIPAPAFTDGTSLVPTLTGQSVQADKGYLYFEFNYAGIINGYHDFPTHGNERMYQQQAIRIGDYMGVRTDITSAADPFKIYNVVTDPKEAINLASSRPDLQARMNYLGVAAHRPLLDGSGVTRPYDTANIPAVTPNPVTNGLKYQSYEGYWPWLPEFRSLAPVSSGLTANITPAVRSRTNDAGISFTGYISVPTTGAYTFALNSNSGSSLWIDEGHVIDNDYNYTVNKTSDPVYLQAGLHPIRLYYRHQNGTPALSLSYSGPGIALTPVPDSSLFTDGPAAVIQLQADPAVTKRNNPILVDVLANDTANYPLSLSSVGSAISGTAVISSGKVLYTPAAGFMGADTISYTALAAATTASSTITASVLFDNEIWIPLDEGSGVNVKAISTTSPATGTLIGTSNPSLSWLDGKYKKCLTFDGVDDQVDFPTLSLPTGASPRTFSCWLKTAATTTGELQTIFSYGTSAAGQRFTVRLNNTSGVASSQAIRLDVDGGSIVGTKTVNDGLWHHIAIVNADQNNDSIVNVNETLLYVDGVPDPVSSSSSMPLATVAGFTPCIGGSNHATNYNFNGAIEDVRIFPRALSYAEVAGLKIAMDQSSGSTDSDGDGATDLQESIAGTDPYNANSVFKITSSTRSTQAITLHWSAVAGKTYSVEESPDLAVWTPVPNVPAVVPVTSNPDATVSVPMSIQAKRFLRLSVK